MKKNLLITGGSGFLGINLANKLKKKYNVFLGSRNNKRNFEAKTITGCEIYPLDVVSKSSIKDAFNYIKPEIVIHAAATKFVDLSEKFPFECTDVNILGSTNIARACIDYKVKIAIGVSTDKASQPIKNLYGMSKAVMEKIFLAANDQGKTNFICVRYGNVAWSTGSVLPIWKQMFEKNKIIFTTGPYMRRFFFTVDEAVELILVSLKRAKLYSGKIVSTEMKSAKMIDILKVWIANFGGKYKIVNLRKGDRIDEYLIGYNELKFTSKEIINGKKYFIIDFKQDNKKSLKKIVSSENSKKLSKYEILRILRLNI
tara:strand:+ start:2398 stop:3339 length:942 start_codon:yes stop_codon:yes gene_type:complete